MSIEFKRPKTSSATIELTPLIDIIFQLLIFFMITSSVSQSSLEVQLPILAAESPLEDSPSLILSILTDGSLKLNGELLPENALEEKLSLALNENPTLFLEADQTVPYDTILRVLKKVREAGIKSINFLHEIE